MSTGFWTLDRIAAALADQAVGRLPRGPTQVSVVTTDTRKIQKGNVFVALRGERFDGHDYLSDAVRDGASALVVSRVPKLNTLGVPIFEVRDTLIALGALAHYWRKAWGKTIVAVAGSNGKTSTKDLIKAALSGAYTVHATSGNLNNRIGVPLTLLALPPEAEVAVVEVGTSLPGEVAILRDIAEPDMSLVTSIAEEHLEGLGDLGGVLREEVAIYDGVAVGIAPSAQPEIAEVARGKARRLIVAGLESNADVKPDRWEIGPRECGVSYEDATAGIADVPQPKMRSSWEQVGGVTLINDAYNANPGSSRAAIEFLKGTGSGRQRVIVLGTMRELGAASQQCHADIAGLALASGADIVAGIGEFAPALEKQDQGDRVITAADVEDLWPRLQARLQRNAIILLKASRGVQLERLVPHLTTWATA